MKRRYEYLNAEERAPIMVMKGQNASVRKIAQTLGRCCSTIRRKLQYRSIESGDCRSRPTGERARELRSIQRRRR